MTDTILNDMSILTAARSVEKALWLAVLERLPEIPVPARYDAVTLGLIAFAVRMASYKSDSAEDFVREIGEFSELLREAADEFVTAKWGKVPGKPDTEGGAYPNG